MAATGFKVGSQHFPYCLWNTSINGKEVTMPFAMPVGGLIWGIITLIFGIIVMIFPKILNYLVGIYLIVVGLLAIFGAVI